MIAALIQAMELAEGDTLLPGSSFSHIGGSLFGLSTLAAGGRLIIPRGSDGLGNLAPLAAVSPDGAVHAAGRFDRLGPRP